MEKNRAASIPNSPIGYGILLSLITFLALLLAAEIAFRFTPVCDSVYSTTTTAADTVYRCRPNREVFLSAFWNFAMQNKVRVNNAGFVSDLAFDADDPRPLLAVVGDSYVEALWVPWPESLAGRLHQALSPDYRVYAISKSGSPMSQYLVYAQFARDTYQPAALVVVIIDNDFDQSLPRYKHNPGFHQFVGDGSGNLRLVLTPYQPGWGLRLARHSALGRYLTINLGVQHTHHRIGFFLNPESYYRDPSAAGNKAKIRDCKPVVDTFLKRLPKAAGLPPEKILLVMDGMRPDLYDDQRLAQTGETFTGVMRDYFMNAAAGAGFEVLDMQGIFAGHFRENGQRFEFPRDPHWNSLGHDVVAKAVLSSPFISTLRQRLSHSCPER